MKALFVGLGSIGMRHLKNLSAVCENRGIPLEVTALRSGDTPLPEDVAPLVQSQVRALPDGGFDLAFITGPTSLHALTLGQLKGRAEAFFIEKPIFDHPNYDLELLGLSESQKAYVAAPMRWTALFMALKKRLPALQVYSARAICSSYLPDWRKGVDYRQIYSAKKAMGGGVSLDLIHEWDYLYDLFGPPLQSCGLRGQVSHLEIDSDDISVYIARWQGLLGELHLDYFGRGYTRKLELLCQNGTLTADFGAGTLTLPNGATEDFSEDVNCRYVREMDYFVSYALAGQGPSLNSPRQALRVLRTALGECEGESHE